MTILFVNERCGYFGGVEQNIADVAAGLRARGHHCHLLAQAETTRDVAGYRALFDACHACNLADAAAIAACVAAVRPAVVYVHKVTQIAPLLALPKPLRIVRMIHDHDVCCPRRHKYFAYNSRICRHAAGWRCWADGAFVERDRTAPLGVRYHSIPATLRELRANHALDAVIVGSRFMRDELCDNGFAAPRVHVLAPIVRWDARAGTPAPDEPRIVYIGQLIRGKGVDLLLRALALVRAPWQAEIVGDGNARAALERLCRQLGLCARVQFRGWVDNAALGAVYTRAKVVVVPSRWPEPFGMVGLEAMRHARPVVAFAVGGIPDWCVDGVTGILAPEQDLAAFARGLEQVLHDTPRARQMGAAALAHVTAAFNFDAYLGALERVFTHT